MPLRHFGAPGQRTHGTCGAVNRIHHHDVMAMTANPAGQMPRVVVAKRISRRALHIPFPVMRYGPDCQGKPASARRQWPAAARPWPNGPTNRRSPSLCRPRTPGKPSAFATGARADEAAAIDFGDKCALAKTALLKTFSLILVPSPGYNQQGSISAAPWKMLGGQSRRALYFCIQGKPCNRQPPRRPRWACASASPSKPSRML